MFNNTTLCFFYLSFFLQGKGEGTPHYHFHPLHGHLDIIWAITVESSPLHIASSRTRTGNLWFTRANKILKHALKDLFTKVLFSYNVAGEAKKIITFSGLRGYSKGVFRTQSNICDGNFLHKYNIFTKKFQLRYSTVLYMPLDISNFLPSW